MPLELSYLHIIVEDVVFGNSLSPIFNFGVVVAPTVPFLLQAKVNIAHVAMYAWAWHIWNWWYFMLWSSSIGIIMFFSNLFAAHSTIPLTVNHIWHMLTNIQQPNLIMPSPPTYMTLLPGTANGT